MLRVSQVGGGGGSRYLGRRPNMGVFFKMSFPYVFSIKSVLGYLE